MIEIRIATSNDLDFIIDLEKQFKEDAMTRTALKRQLGNQFFKVLILSNSVWGYYLALTRKNSNAIRLYSICIDRELQGQGYGKNLLFDLINESKKHDYKRITLEVAEHNKARHLYKSIGFKDILKIENYYFSKENAIKMELNIYNHHQ